MSEAGSAVAQRPGGKKHRLSRMHRHSLHVGLLLLAAAVAFGFWAFARLFICWGSTGIFGASLCDSFWLFPLIVLGAVGFVIFAYYDLSGTAIAEFEPSWHRRLWAFWRAYSRLTWFEIVVSLLVLILVAVAVFLLFKLFTSSIRL